MLLIGILSGCEDKGEDYAPQFADTPPGNERVLILGVHPLHNPQRLFQVYQPLVDHLNRNLQGSRIKLEASRSYADYEKKLSARYFHLALPNPYQTVAALDQGYQVFGKMADDEQFRGIIVVRKDGGIRQPADLRGKAVSYPAATALAAAVLPQWFLHQQGLVVTRDLDNRYVGSQESSIMNVYLGNTAAGATWPPPWRAFVKAQPEIAAHLEVRWETEHLVNNSLIARDDLPPELVTEVGRLIFGLQDSEQGRAILAPMELSRFEPASRETYRPVEDFLARFEREVRRMKE